MDNGSKSNSVIWLPYEEWKHMKDWQRRKEIELLPPWMVWFLYGQTMMEIESKIDMTKLLSKEPTIKVNEEYQWEIMKQHHE